MTCQRWSGTHQPPRHGCQHCQPWVCTWGASWRAAGVPGSLAKQRTRPARASADASCRPPAGQVSAVQQHARHRARACRRGARQPALRVARGPTAGGRRRKAKGPRRRPGAGRARGARSPRGVGGAARRRRGQQRRRGRGGGGDASGGVCIDRCAVDWVDRRVNPGRGSIYCACDAAGAVARRTPVALVRIFVMSCEVPTPCEASALRAGPPRAAAAPAH